MLATCKACGNTFEARRSGAQVCGNTCRMRLYRARARLRKASTACEVCGAPIPSGSRRRKFCSMQCARVARNETERAYYASSAERRAKTAAKDSARRVPCAECGEPIYVGTTSRPVGVATCRGCAEPGWPSDLPKYDRECWWCGVAFGARHRSQRFCSSTCAGRRQPKPGRISTADRYDARQKAAPGLSEYKRLRLLAKWKRQGRACSYCGGPCESVDHVVPLSRGGDNREGNLAPACLRCNRRKNHRLLVEWRTAA